MTNYFNHLQKPCNIVATNSLQKFYIIEKDITVVISLHVTLITVADPVISSRGAYLGVSTSDEAIF